MPTLTATIRPTQTVEKGLFLDWPKNQVPDGGLTDGQNVEPDIGLMRRAPGWNKFSTTALPGVGPCMLIQELVTSVEARTLFVITTTRTSTYNAGTGLFSDITGGLNLLTGASTNPIFGAALGDLFIFTNGVNAIKKSNGSTYADLAGSPPLALGLDVYEGHVLLWNTTTGGTQTSFRVQWSDLNLPESWAVATGSEAGSLDIRENNLLPILAGAKMRRQYLLYKEEFGGVYALTYIGGATPMQQELVIPRFGVFSPKGVVADGDVHYVLGSDEQIWKLAPGSSPIPIGDGVRKRLFKNLNWNARRAAFLSVNHTRHQLLVAIPEGASTTCTRAYAFNTLTGAWGERDFQMQAAAQVRDPRTTAISALTGTIANLLGTIASLSSFGKDIFLVGTPSASSFAELYEGADQMDGTEVDGWVVGKWNGSGGLRQARLRGVEVDIQAGSIVVEVGTASSLSGTMSFVSAGNPSNGRVDTNASAQYIAPRIRSQSGGGQWELTGYRPDIYPRGRR